MSDYKFVGGKRYIPGVPARDLTEEEWKAIPAQWRALAERLYRKAKVTKKEVSNGDV